MLKYYLDISVDDDFGVNSSYFGKTVTNPDFIRSINGNKAIIDPNLFIGRNFFKPIERLLENDVPLSKLRHDDFVKIVSKFGKNKITNSKKRTIIDFNSNNNFDLNCAYIENSDQVRILFDYKNSPIDSFYLLDDDGIVKIMVSPFTKNYYVLDETEWWYFVDYLTKKESISELRDIRINQVLSDKPDKSVNLIRQLKFYLKKDSNSFLNDVLSFYSKKGYLTDKQFDAVAKKIDWRLLHL